MSTEARKLTAQDLRDMEPGTIFAEGEAIDEAGGLFMANTGKLLKWIAVRGVGMHDWTIYCHLADQSREWIRRHGDKVHMKEHIKKLVPCHPEAFALYRQ